MTEIGIMGDSPVYSLGPAGTLAGIGEPWQLDWWVGAEDRWHLASEEAAVRQSLAEDNVSIETRIKVPGGDAIQRVSVVPWGSASVAIVDVHNATAVPFAIGMAIRFEPGQVSVYDDTISVDGKVVMRAGRSVARIAIAGSIEEARALVESAAAVPPAELDGPVSGAAAVAIFPVPHTATLSVAWVRGGVADLAAPQDLPPFEAVGRGWETHLGNGASLVVPDERLLQATRAARRHLLTGSARPVTSPFWSVGTEPWLPAVAAAALDDWGHHVEARSLLLRASGIDEPAEHASRPIAASGALLWAWAESLERVPDQALEAALKEWTQHLIAALLIRPRRFGRRRDGAGAAGWRAIGLAAGASLAARFGEGTLAGDIIDAVDALAADVDTSDPADLLPLALGGRRLDTAATAAPIIGVLLQRAGVAPSGNPLAALVARSSPTGGLASPTGGLASPTGGLASPTGDSASTVRSQDPGWSALLLIALRRAVVDEPRGAGGPVALLGAPDRQWLGGHLEAHGMPIGSKGIGSGSPSAGTVSFGVRWHGDRPALLWDRSDVNGEASVTTPYLDPSWSSTEPKGETLLAPTESLGDVGAMDSPTIRSGEVIDPGDEPQSFA